MIKKLKTLEEHNRGMINDEVIDNSPVLNNIACPQCGKELYDSRPLMILTSLPAQKEIHCESCNWTGFRVC